jgi:hypothetical protein
MATNTQGERRSHFRSRGRPGRRVDLHYTRKDGKDTASGTSPAKVVTSNIGVGGAFVLTDTPEEVGAALSIALKVPDRIRAIVLEAEVRWADD